MFGGAHRDRPVILASRPPGDLDSFEPVVGSRARTPYEDPA
jgi:hypothetical protein